jgi:single-strand DNA-binding protein
LRKGSKVLVEGRLIFEQWVDQTGAKRSKHTVTVENMQMLDSRSDSAAMNGGANGMQSNGGYNNGYNQTPNFSGANMQQQQQQNHNQSASQGFNQSNSYEQTTPNIAPKEMPTNDSIPEIDIDEDEIPF